MSYLNAFGIEESKDQPHQLIVYNLALIYNVIYDEMAEFFSPYLLTPGKFNILMIVKHQGKDSGISQADIGKHLILTPSNMTKLIDKLEADQLLVRSALKGDRRVNVVKITFKGSHLLDRIWEGYNEKLLGLTVHLSRQDQKTLAQLLQLWLESMKGENIK